MRCGNLYPDYIYWRLLNRVGRRANLMPAVIPLNPAPITTTLNGLSSSILEVPSLKPSVFALLSWLPVPCFSDGGTSIPSVGVKGLGTLLELKCEIGLSGSVAWEALIFIFFGLSSVVCASEVGRNSLTETWILSPAMLRSWERGYLSTSQASVLNTR